MVNVVILLPFFGSVEVYLGGTQLPYVAGLTLTAEAPGGVDTGSSILTQVRVAALIDVLHTVCGVGPT